jgi:hypothetical protein
MLKEFVPEQLLERSEGLEEFLDALWEVLEDVKQRIDDFPKLIDIEEIQEPFLTFLALSYNLQVYPQEKWRELLREAVALLRERGELESFKRLFSLHGYNAEARELYHEVMSLGSGLIGEHRLGGKKYSRGSILLVNYSNFDDLREIAYEYKPAGRVCWVEYKKVDALSEVVREAHADISFVWYACVAERPAHGIFEVGQSIIGGEDVIGWDVSAGVWNVVKSLMFITTNATTDFPISVDKFGNEHAYYIYPTEPPLFGAEITYIGRNAFAE